LCKPARIFVPFAADQTLQLATNYLQDQSTFVYALWSLNVFQDIP
jgi:hypothetical protein